MEINKYNYEILGLKGKKLGEILNDESTEEEMKIKAEGIMMGVGVLRSLVVVRVRDERGKIVYELKKINGICY